MVDLFHFAQKCFSSRSFSVKAHKLVASYECINNVIIMVIITNAIENSLYAKHYTKPFMKTIVFNSHNHLRQYSYFPDKKTSLYR